MASNKYQLARIRIIDRELQRKSRVKTKNLVRIIQTELDIKVSPRTVQNDIALMQYDSTLGYYAPIEKDTKTKAWYYRDSDFTITAFKLKEEEIKSLSLYAKILGTYREAKIFNHFSSAIEKVMEAVKIQETASDERTIDSFVRVDRHPPYSGSEFIAPIITALQENREIKISYQKFADENPKTQAVCPYLLKSFENRWYLIAKRDGQTVIYGTDRIRDLEILNTSFERESIDFDKYFRHSLGITVTDDKPVEIVLSFTQLQGKYIKSLPLHDTQKIISDNENELKISVFVRPTFEFYSKVLSYGAAVRVLSPAFVVDELKTRIKETLERYD